MIPQAAGITAVLTDAGLSSDDVHRWFGEPRFELVGLSPRVYLDIVPFTGGERVLALARSDMDALTNERQEAGNGRR